VNTLDLMPPALDEGAKRLGRVDVVIRTQRRCFGSIWK
jgi:hypothetical protein